jgi:hypothetical protein
MKQEQENDLQPQTCERLDDSVKDNSAGDDRPCGRVKRQEKCEVSISADQKASLEALAEKLGYMWGQRPNISGLMKAIADGEVAIGKLEAIKRKR